MAAMLDVGHAAKRPSTEVEIGDCLRQRNGVALGRYVSHRRKLLSSWYSIEDSSLRFNGVLPLCLLDVCTGWMCAPLEQPEAVEALE